MSKGNLMGRLVPLILFLALGALLAVGLTIADRKTELPSPLVGKPMPEFNLPMLGQEDVTISSAELLGEPFLLNFWASWCVTCRIEHPIIEQLAESGLVRVIGMNFRDQPEDALAWLDHFGNPYAMNIADLSGRTSIDFGVYAAPESFLVNAEGKIIFKQLGMITPEIIKNEIVPRLKQNQGERK